MTEPAFERVNIVSAPPANTVVTLDDGAILTVQLVPRWAVRIVGQKDAPGIQVYNIQFDLIVMPMKPSTQPKSSAPKKMKRRKSK
jgi:hypothetical protein